MRYYKTQGIIIRKTQLAERDHRLTIFTRWKGKIEVIAKGTQNIKSRRLGALELPNLALFQIYENTNNKYLSQCELLDSFYELKQSLKSIGHIHYLAELTDKLTPFEQKAPLKFNLLKNTLSILKNAQKAVLILEHFKIKLLDLSGFMPDFKVCSVCGGKINSKFAYLSKNHLQMYCEKCYLENVEQKDLIPLNTRNLKLICYLKKHLNYPQAPRIKTEQKDIYTLNNLTSLFINHHLVYELNSSRFLDKIHNMM